MFKISSIILALLNNNIILASMLIQSCKTIECFKCYEEEIHLCEIYILVGCKTAIINICNQMIKNEVVLDMIRKTFVPDGNGNIVIIPSN
jgi:hypothetical protein